MKIADHFLRPLLLTTAALMLAGCEGGTPTTASTTPAGEASLDTLDQRYAYIIGNNLAQQMKRDDLTLDRAAFLLAFDDIEAGKDSRLSQEEMQAAIKEFQTISQQKAKAKRKAELDKNKADGAAYLAANGAKDGVVTTASGLQYRKLKTGSGARPTANDRVRVHYEGRLIDGTVFDSSLKRGEPATFGVGGVISGWTEALQLMQVGDQFELVIPSDLAYGLGGSRSIGPASTLIFEVELLGIEK